MASAKAKEHRFMLTVHAMWGTGKMMNVQALGCSSARTAVVTATNRVAMTVNQKGAVQGPMPTQEVARPPADGELAR